MWNAPDYIAELALIEASRIQREAVAYDMVALEAHINEEDKESGTDPLTSW